MNPYLPDRAAVVLFWSDLLTGILLLMAETAPFLIDFVVKRGATALMKTRRMS